VNDFELIALGRLTAAQRADLHGGEEDPFDAAGSTIQWRPKDHHLALRGPGGRLVASTGFVVAEVAVADERFPVIGIGGVIVNRAFRGHGLATAVVGSVLEFGRTLGPPFAMLFCHGDRAGLYEKLGFAAVVGPVEVEQPSGPALMTQLSMQRPLLTGAVWPAGPVRVIGLPF
jgi:GNAT superfamily N-acetyltransferase